MRSVWQACEMEMRQTRGYQSLLVATLCVPLLLRQVRKGEVMNLDELKKNLHDVIERYNNKTEFCGEIRRDDMARDCLQVVEELEAENERLKQEVADYHQLQWQHDALIDENERLKAKLDAKTMYAEARNDDAHMYAEEIRNMNENFGLLEAENAKLECLALHLFKRLAYDEYADWYGIADGLAESKIKKRCVRNTDRWWRIAKRCNEAYHKAKKALRAGK